MSTKEKLSLIEIRGFVQEAMMWPASNWYQGYYDEKYHYLLFLTGKELLLLDNPGLILDDYLQEATGRMGLKSGSKLHSIPKLSQEEKMKLMLDFIATRQSPEKELLRKNLEAHMGALSHWQPYGHDQLFSSFDNNQMLILSRKFNEYTYAALKLRIEEFVSKHKLDIREVSVYNY